MVLLAPVPARHLSQNIQLALDSDAAAADALPSSSHTALMQGHEAGNGVRSCSVGYLLITISCPVEKDLPEPL